MEGRLDAAIEYGLGDNMGDVIERVVARDALGCGDVMVDDPVLPNPPSPLVVLDNTDVVEILG